MKLLLCISSLGHIQSVLAEKGMVLNKNTLLPFLYSSRILHHETDILSTGAGVYQTTYKLAKVLQKNKYHLALKLSLGNAYKIGYPPGTVLNIVNEKPGDYGMFIDGEWNDLYNLGLLKNDEEPQVRGGYINLTNAYMNIFLPFKKAVGITVNNYANMLHVFMRTEKYKADCETTDGLGFAYTCLFERQQFYHLCFIERNLVTGEENYNLAQSVLNNTLVEILEKL